MSSSKRFVVLAPLVALAFLGSAAVSEAQFRGRSRVVVVGGYYASPFWLYDPWWGYGSQWGPYPYPYPPYRYVDTGASVRLEVKPKETEVYVDGYYAGIVDDFDGVFQRMHVPPGEHEITLYLDGYRTTTQRVYLTPDNTFKIKYTMERLAPGDQPQPRPQPPAPPAAPQAGPPTPYPPTPYPPAGRGPGRRAPQPPQSPQPPQAPEAPGPPPPPPGQAGRTGADQFAYGRLAIRVQPADSEVLIDGEPWRGSDGSDRLIVEVAGGRHTIEIRKSGYRTLITDVNVRPNETTPLNVSLKSETER